jgi:hypothetical protein
MVPDEVLVDDALEVGDVLEATELGELYGVVDELGVVVEETGALVDVLTAAELVAVKEYVMQEHAELTAATSLLQLLKSVGIADGAVVVPERNLGQNVSASATKRSSMRFL